MCFFYLKLDTGIVEAANWPIVSDMFSCNVSLQVLNQTEVKFTKVTNRLRKDWDGEDGHHTAPIANLVASVDDHMRTSSNICDDIRSNMMPG